MFLQHNASNNTDRIISLLQDQIEFLQEELKSKNKIVNSLIENLSRNDDVFFFLKRKQHYKLLKTKLITSNYKIKKPSTARRVKIKTLQNASALKKKKASRPINYQKK